MKEKIVVLMIVSCLGLAACNKVENIEHVEINSTIQDEVDIDVEDNVASEEDHDSLYGVDQIALIAANKDEWLLKSEGDLYVYAVTDLNANGRLEVIGTSTQGSGLYSYTNYFEVNEDGTGLESWTAQREEGMSEPDIGYNNFPVFYEKESHTYTYIISDFYRMDAAHSGGTIYGVTYENGEIIEVELGRETYQYDETSQTEETKYYNAQGAEITAEEYLALPRTIYAEYDEKLASFQWILAEDLDIPDIETALGVLYQGFSIE